MGKNTGPDTRNCPSKVSRCSRISTISNVKVAIIQFLKVILVEHFDARPRVTGVRPRRVDAHLNYGGAAAVPFACRKSSLTLPDRKLPMLQFVPDAERLARIFSQATAPTFFLGAVAGFVSLMASRLSGVIQRTRDLNAIADDDKARHHLKADLDRLRHRAKLLNSGILASLRGGICATVLLAVLFVSEFLGFKYAYGAGLLFVVSTFFVGFALFRFAQEANISLNQYDEQQ
jgi:hypothetical protein